ncbi:hypothetical protein BFC18_17195 [Alteromonas confluentis]|uniref:Uncharacterized protein n=1 Tax=Alteromonas confluentis TaxID=1656094 RepID=A0A1E7Z7T9_9ALTE|nr:hypothetical protein BFC18_17195 [Alteromonas confluentis]
MKSCRRKGDFQTTTIDMLLLLQLPLNSTTLLKPDTKRALMFVPKQHGDVLKPLLFWLPALRF